MTRVKGKSLTWHTTVGKQFARRQQVRPGAMLQREAVARLQREAVARPGRQGEGQGLETHLVGVEEPVKGDF